MEFHESTPGLTSQLNGFDFVKVGTLFIGGYWKPVGTLGQALYIKNNRGQ